MTSTSYISISFMLLCFAVSYSTQTTTSTIPATSATTTGTTQGTTTTGGGITTTGGGITSTGGGITTTVGGDTTTTTGIDNTGGNTAAPRSISVFVVWASLVLAKLLHL